LFGTVPLKTVRTLQLELGASTLQLGKKSFGGTHTKTNRESCTPILGFSSSSRLGETTNRGGKKSIFRIRYERWTSFDLPGTWPTCSVLLQVNRPAVDFWCRLSTFEYLGALAQN